MSDGIAWRRWSWKKLAVAAAAACGLVLVSTPAALANTAPGGSGNWEAEIPGYCIAVPIQAQLLPVKIRPKGLHGSSLVQSPQTCYPAIWAFANTGTSGDQIWMRTDSPTNFHLTPEGEIQQNGTDKCWTLNASTANIDQHVACTSPAKSWQVWTFGSTGTIHSAYNGDCVYSEGTGIALGFAGCNPSNRFQQFDWSLH